MELRIKRVYEEPAEEDGYRVLVDRLWPRGLSKENARIDRWAKEVAPSNDLRKWIHEDPGGRWKEFVDRYRRELDGREEAVRDLRDDLEDRDVATLLFAVKDEERNHAKILRGHLLDSGNG